MLAPSLPQDEDQRIGTLRQLNVLDTMPEERFDRLTRLAKRVFDVPIALVSLVDTNRQWFKSCFGLDAQETGRDISFCGHAILDWDLFIIPDAAADERFADNPLVTGPPNIRFYAGCPLTVSNGARLGTLCIIDRRPRELTEEDKEVLRDLGQMAAQELETVQLATLDELTGLSNRRGFEHLGEHALSTCARTERSATLLYLDLDNFKPINDQFGHAEGDRALAAFSVHLRSTFRASDVIARIGGDEFVVLMTGPAESAVDAALTRLSAAVQEDNGNAARGYDIGYSVGRASYQPGSPTPPSIEALLSAADADMYAQKRARHARAS